MTAIRAIFDGKAFVPEQPVDIPVGTAASVVVSSAPSPPQPTSTDQTSDKLPRRPLAELARLLDSLPDNSELPADFASEMDHYLYGMPKRGNQ
jgi:hypothetical protein